MAHRVETLTERLERIKKQNAEIRLRHLEVEADKKMAERSRALVHNHVTTSINDMMPAERDAILNKSEQIESGQIGSISMEKQNKGKNVFQPTKLHHPYTSVSQRLEKKYGSRSEEKFVDSKQKKPPSRRMFIKNDNAKFENDDDDDNGDLFKNVEDLGSDDFFSTEQVQLSGVEINDHKASSYMDFGYGVEQDCVPDCQKRLDAAVPASPSDSSPFFQFLPNMDFSVPPPHFIKGNSLDPVNPVDPQLNVSIPPPSYNRNVGDSEFNTQSHSSQDYSDVPNIYVPYTPLVGPNIMHPTFDGIPLASEAAPYPRSVTSHRSSPPCGLLPPSTTIIQHDNISEKYTSFQPDFTDPNEISAHGAFDWCNELPSIQLLEKALHAIGGKGQLIDSQYFQRNVNNTPLGAEDCVLNVSGIEIPKEVASDLLKKALAIVSKEMIDKGKLNFNSDSKGDVNGMQVLQLILQSSEQNPNKGSGNGRPILGRGARDQDVAGIEQANYHSHHFPDKPIDHENRHFPASYQNVVEDQNSNISKHQPARSYDQENCRYRPILGRTASDFETNNPPSEPITRNIQPPAGNYDQRSKNNKSEPKKKSNLLARMEAARNDNSHRFSRSFAMSQQKVGTVQVSYQGRVIQSLDETSPAEPKSDSHIFACSDVREKDKKALEAQSREVLQEQKDLDVVKALVAKKTQLEKDLKYTKESNMKIEEKLKSLSLQKLPQVNEIPQ